ncbi:hypothetical protein BS78_05G105500 [Paspalum vaginatum]|nr:hypothetical protein BS78_05G105500 [Paspalum vaginatum]
MPRELRVTPAMAPAPALAASVAGVSYKSLLRVVRIWDLEAKVITAWIIWLILRQLQSYLGPMRRRSTHKVVQYGAMAAYYLPSVLAFYAASAMHSSTSSFKIELSLGCALMLFLSTGGAVAMTTLTLGRGPRRRLIPWLLFGAWLQWDSISSGRRQTVSDLISFGIVFLGPVIYAVAAKPRVAALDYETKQFADYMMRESRSSSSSSSSPFFNDHANSLYDGCKYPLKQLNDGRWISFSDVLQHRGWLPSDCADEDQVDTCLSYTFCRLLARRYFGFPCAEDGNRLVREFVLKELMADYNRAFTIVEVQLALLHDYFFTNYHSYILQTGSVSAKKGAVKYFNASVIFVAGAAASFIIRGGSKQGLSSLVVFLYALAVPAALMYIMIAQQQFPSLPRYWHPIQNLFMYYSTAATTGFPSGPCVVIDWSASPQCQSSRLYYWRDKLGQYSVVEDYDRRSAKKTIMARCMVHVLSQVSYSFIKHHPAQGQEVRVPDGVRRLVAQAMKDCNGLPTMVTKSLVLDDLSWTYRQETLTHTILIWHIATCYCDMLFQSQAQALAAEADTNHQAATILSRYCAYLVAFLPELLPDHALSAKVVLQQVLQETKDLLGTTRMSMEAKIRRIRELQLAEDESSLTNFQKGVQLGRQLEQQADVSLRRKAMADFWVEMILHLASSSENVAAHVEQLAQGGEFVTHLWALLCNAGVTLKREKEEWNPTAQPNKAIVNGGA